MVRSRKSMVNLDICDLLMFGWASGSLFDHAMCNVRKSPNPTLCRLCNELQWERGRVDLKADQEASCPYLILSILGHSLDFIRIIYSSFQLKEFSVFSTSKLICLLLIIAMHIRNYINSYEYKYSYKFGNLNKPIWFLLMLRDKMENNLIWHIFSTFYTYKLHWRSKYVRILFEFIAGFLLILLLLKGKKNLLIGKRYK